MKEINQILKTYQKWDLSQQKTALATVIHVEGSSYRRTGARMLVLESGQWIGGISGGCLEGDALRKAKNAMVQSKPTIVTYDTREEDAHQIGVGLGCNGLIQVLIAPLKPDDERNPLEILKNCVDDRKANILLTITKVEGGFRQFLGTGDMFRFEDTKSFLNEFPNTEISDLILNEIESTIKKQKSQMFSHCNPEKGNLEIFVEYLPPATHLILFGGNYDIYPFAKLAKEIGWKVSIVANPQKLDKSAFSIADAVISNKTGEVTSDEHTAWVLMAHDYKTDFNNLKKALEFKASYIGVLGPKKRFDKMITSLAEEGLELSENQMARIHAPVGLDIGATSPEEIAISIIAEIRACFAMRTGGFLKLRDKPIYS